MEDAMHTEEIRRRSNGTIDIGFYRQRATALRSQAQTGALRKLGGAIRPLIAAIILALSGATLPARQPTPPLV
jgi:hypothetical protein